MSDERTPDVEIIEPFEFRLSIVEIADERLPSFRAEIDFIAKHPTGFFQYEAEDIWFETTNWDTFRKELGELTRGKASSASLKDMSTAFVIEASVASPSLYKLLFSMEEPDTGQGHGKMCYVLDVERDVLSMFYNRIEAFLIWW